MKPRAACLIKVLSTANEEIAKMSDHFKPCTTVREYSTKSIADFPALLELVVPPKISGNIPLNVKIRPIQRGDGAALFAAIEENRTHLREWLPWLDSIETIEDVENVCERMAVNSELVDPSITINTTLSESEAPLEGDVKRVNRKPLTSLDCMILVNNVVAGTIGFNYLDYEKRFGYIGYWLSKHLEGNGIMTLCTEKMVEYGFSELELDHVLIAVAKDNLKSRRIPEKRLEGFQMLEWVKDMQMLYGKEVEMVTYIKSVEKPKYSHKDLPLSGIYGGEKQQHPDNNR